MHAPTFWLVIVKISTLHGGLCSSPNVLKDSNGHKNITEIVIDENLKICSNSASFRGQRRSMKLGSCDNLNYATAFEINSICHVQMIVQSI